MPAEPFKQLNCAPNDITIALIYRVHFRLVCRRQTVLRRLRTKRIHQRRSSVPVRIGGTALFPYTPTLLERSNTQNESRGPECNTNVSHISTIRHSYILSFNGYKLQKQKIINVSLYPLQTHCKYLNLNNIVVLLHVAHSKCTHIRNLEPDLFHITLKPLLCVGCG